MQTLACRGPPFTDDGDSHTAALACFFLRVTDRIARPAIAPIATSATLTQNSTQLPTMIAAVPMVNAMVMMRTDVHAAGVEPCESSSAAISGDCPGSNEEPGFDDHGPTIGGAKPATQRINAIATATFAKTNNFTTLVMLIKARMTVAIASQAAPSTPREPPTGVDRVAR